MYEFVTLHTLQGNRPDWVSGKLGLPEFHCPRCRDHWYGVTDVPCDEELARLIREGLWRTGQEGEGGGGRNKHRRRKEHSRGDKDRDYRSYSSDSLTSKSSNTRLNGNSENGTESKGQHRSNLTNEEKERKKPKKRITFKLDNEFESSGGSNSGSNTQLEGGARRVRRAKGYGIRSRLSSGEGGQSGISAGADEQATGTNSVKCDVGDGRDFSNGGEASEGGIAGRRRKGARNSSEQLDSDNSGLLENTRGRKNKTGKNSSGGASGLTRFGEQANKELEGDGQSLRGRGTQDRGADYETKNGTGNRQSRNYEDSENKSLQDEENSDSTRRIDAFADTNQPGNNGTGTVGHSNNESQRRGGKKVGGADSTSLSSSSQTRSSTGSRRGSISMDDHGKNVRKPGGYMRAVSPSASDWGDPTHARSFISSTATSRSVSRTGSLVNLGGTEEEEQRLSLPPIIPAINSKKPLLDLSDIMGGFQFTRAWTFSYHK